MKTLCISNEYFRTIMKQTMIAGSIAVLVFVAVTMENVPSDSMRYELAYLWLGGER